MYRVTCLENDGTLKNGDSEIIAHQAMAHRFLEMENLTMLWVLRLVLTVSYMLPIEIYRIQVLDRNGTFIRKFSEQGTAPGSLSKPEDIEFCLMKL